MKKPLFLAYFLPQFHECKYNNKWWGKGFTEWVNVKLAKPLKTGHRQPRIPVDGYYDLTTPGEMEKQFSLANAHGIDGFVFYHYWYRGERPLGEPLEYLLENTDEKINFSLCWANHSWTRSWKNRSGSLHVLIEQQYAENSSENIEQFSYLAKAFKDHRYIRIDGKPLFQIYIPEDVKNLKAFVFELRQYMIKNHNLELHLSATIRQRMNSYEYLQYFDSATLAQPTLGIFSSDDLFGDGSDRKKISTTIREKILTSPAWFRRIVYFLQDLIPKRPTFFDYDKIWMNVLMQSRNSIKYQEIPINLTAFVDFDNTPRYKQNAKIIEGFSPMKFAAYLKQLVNLARDTEHQLVFINAWNEWGEGMYLEGDMNYPNERLNAVAEAACEKND